MSDDSLAAVRINQELCSRCKVCYSLCPFEAIEILPEGKLVHNFQKCQVCGICYSACPASAIEISYYDYEGLLDHVRSACRHDKAETLVVMCRGNSPKSGEVEDILASEGLNTKCYIPMRVPCAGRIPTNFFFRALKSGVKNVVSIQCQDDFCRMKEGTQIGTRRIMLGDAVVQSLGYPENTLKVVKFSRKVIRINKECVGCGKCVFVCPYGAISAEPFSTPTTDPEKCMGCGSCQLVCPHNAILVKGYAYEDILASYAGAAERMKAHSTHPSILVLSCQWSEYSVLDDPEKTLKGKNAMILEVPCFKGMDPVHVVSAFSRGYDGVMAVVCPTNDCKLPLGRDTSERQLEVLMAYLKRLGLEDRFEIHELSPRLGDDFLKVFDEFSQKIAAMPHRSVPVQKGAQ
ncbi:MAG: Heterodisulfide reductase subunit A-like protein [Methanomassiliicoccales archaeon PtaU1.Bin124]|nr:MAG: Heterodisulfide reductase subunit A-like protein [Methanomassiliicoccales archaeon PtaU1.Bin124]